MTAENVLPFRQKEKIYVSEDIKIIDITKSFFAATIAYFQRPKRNPKGKLFCTRAFSQHREIIWSDFYLNNIGRRVHLVQSRVSP